MKKNFNSWKLLTVIAALIFVASCWYVAYAASSSGLFDSWKVGHLTNQKLTSWDWDALMDELWKSSGIPAWAVMAFNLTECPDWWKDYDAANGRFIIGANSTYPFNSYWWQSKVSLQAVNLPAHKHSIKMVVDWGDVSNDIYFTSGIWNIPRQYEYDDDWGYAFVSTEENYYWDKWFNDDYTAYSKWVTNNYTNRQMKGQEFTVLNPYVALKYCEKK